MGNKLSGLCSGKSGLFEDSEFNSGNVNKDYVFGEVLGRGAFATVRAGKSRKAGQDVAIKVIEKGQMDDAEKDMLRTEVRALRKGKHPNIIQLHDVYDEPSNIHLILERVTGGELFDVIVAKGHFSERDAASVVRQMVEGVHFLHQKGIVHRDLKPENLLFATTQNKILKIADFGLACVAAVPASALFEGASGTPGYVAPEVLKGVKYGYKVDLWSVGVITYILLCGCPPFYDEDMHRLFEMIKRGRFDYDGAVWKDVSSSAKDFINHLLKVNPNERYGGEQALKHPWLLGAASDTPLPDVRREELAKYIAKRRWRKAVLQARFTAAMKIQARFRGHQVRADERDQYNNNNYDHGHHQQHHQDHRQQQGRGHGGHYQQGGRDHRDQGRGHQQDHRQQQQQQQQRGGGGYAYRR